jgi:hypothetical protein
VDLIVVARYEQRAARVDATCGAHDFSIAPIDLHATAGERVMVSELLEQGRQTASFVIFEARVELRY